MLTVPIVAWGRWFVECAQRLLRSLDSPGNLRDVEARVLIYTDTPRSFKGHVCLPVGRIVQKHAVTSDCYTRALQYGAPIVPLAADMIASEGLLAAVQRIAEKADLAVCPVLRAHAEAFVPELPSAGPISLTSRELCRLALEHAHPRQAMQYRENLPAKSQPTTIYRRLNGTVLARCFHMHPIMIRAEKGATLPKGIDGDYVKRVPIDRIHVVTDSDELMVVDTTPADYSWEWDYPDPVDPLAWARIKANQTHWWFFAHECYLHAGEREKLPPDPYCDELLATLTS